MKNIRKKAIVIGVAIDVCWSFAIGLLVGIYFASIGLSEEAIADIMSNNLRADLLFTAMAAVGTVVAGFAAATIARSDRIKHALIVGIIPAVITALTAILNPESAGLMTAITVAANPLASSLGGYLQGIYSREKKR